MISGCSSFYFPGTGRPPLTKPTSHKSSSHQSHISGFPPLDAVPQETSVALTHTQVWALLSAASSFWRALLEASLTWHQTMEAFLVLLLGLFHLVLSMDMNRNRHWAHSTWRAFSLLEMERASPCVLKGTKPFGVASTLWTIRAAPERAETYTPSSGSV